MPARLVTFRFDFEGEWDDVDFDDVREAIGNGTSDIYKDEHLDVSDEEEQHGVPPELARMTVAHDDDGSTYTRI